MKQLLPLLLFATLFTANTDAQESFQSPFRKGSYTRLGLNMMGNALNQNLSVKANMLAGNFGGKMGAVLEKGKIFYFKSNESPSIVNYGLDWTIISVTYNPSKKAWNNYISKSGGANATVSMPMVISLFSKLGPVVSINPVEKLVIDLRGQVAAGVFLFGPMYDETGYSFVALNGEAKSMLDYATLSIKPNIGITIRRAGIGLAFDYSPGKVKAKYTEVINDTDHYGTADIQSNSFQAKLSFTLKK